MKTTAQKQHIKRIHLKSIAVLLTCFNRKAKTLSALTHLYRAKDLHPEIAMVIYLTNDGSTDGTGEAVARAFPKVKILQGNGELFWAGGMRNSWREALKGNYDAFFLLNDDTNLYTNVFDQLLSTHRECLKTYKVPGIYIGSTKEPNTGAHTYGGAVFLNRFMFKYEFLLPTGKVQPCELGNANIMMVTKEVVAKIGILSNGYRHGVADYDYTLMGLKKNIPLLLAPDYCGECTHDHVDIYETFAQKSFKERLRLLKHPLGLDYSSNLLLMRKHFPLRVPFVMLAAALKLLFPNFYVKRRRNA